MRVADNKVTSITAQYRKDLSALYDEREMRAIIAAVFEAQLGWDRAQLELQNEGSLSEHELLLVYGPLSRLAAGEPLQYVLGSVTFHGLRIKVAPGVLIPRPETEELVDRIVNSGTRPSRIVDLGTGSGCIALALQRAYPAAEVVGYDISEEALAIANMNGAELGSRAKFRSADMLDPTFTIPHGTDLIVSNPPYIPRTEEAELERNVKAFEPHVALFVDGKDPLLFYRAIARVAKDALAYGGALWFEVHFKYAESVASVVMEHGFRSVTVHQDLSGNPRSVHAIL